MDISVYYDLFEAGLFPLPIIWDVEKKIASKHPEHDLKNINPELLDSYTAEAVVKLMAISSDNIADLLKDFREKNQGDSLRQ